MLGTDFSLYIDGASSHTTNKKKKIKKTLNWFFHESLTTWT